MIFIIGTGPTLANVDLSKLNGSTTVAINDITKELHYFKPTYWMFMDSTFYRKYMEEIRQAQSDGVTLVTCADQIGGVEKVTASGDRGALAKGKIEFYDKKGGIYRFFSVGATGYGAIQWAWQKGHRKMYIIGFDSRDPLGHENYREDYMDRVKVKRWGTYYPNDQWGVAYDYANKWIWANGGEIWDVSGSKCGSFEYKPLEEAING